MTAFSPAALAKFREFADLAHLHQKHPQQLASDQAVGGWPPEDVNRGRDRGEPQHSSFLRDASPIDAG